MVSFEVPGKAVPKQRPRRARNGHFYTPQPTVEYEREVAWRSKIAMKGRLPFICPVSVSIEIRLVPPRSWYASKQVRALNGELRPSRFDLDNCVKALTDGMNGIVYKDDRQIYEITAFKAYGNTDKVLVEIEEA